MTAEQLAFFPTAPGTKRTRGRGVLRDRLMDFLEQAKNAGCSHVELSTDGVLFVKPEAVGRQPCAQYIPVTDARVLDFLLRRKVRAILN